MTTPAIHYARSGKLRIAYQVVGNGPIDLVLIPGFISNLEIQWEDPGYTHMIRRLSAFCRLIMIDKRGTGLSDRMAVADLPDLETRTDDIRAVMDAAGSGRAALLGVSEGSAMAISFAAASPERTRALLLYGAYAHFHSWAMKDDSFAAFIECAETSWGTGATLRYVAPSRLGDTRFANWWSRLERLSASPTAAVALSRMNAQIDVRKILPRVRSPTLILHRRDDVAVKFAGGKYIAEKIAGAKFVELTGRDHPIWLGDTDMVVDEIEEFLTGMRTPSVDNRILATLMVARLIAPERLARRLGDQRWSERIERLHDEASELVRRHGGQLMSAGSSELSARFDRPAGAVRCALALREAAAALEFPLGTGIHAGEIEIRRGSATGLAIHTAETIAGSAAQAEILVSGIVHDLVAGSGLHFSEPCPSQIEGSDGKMRLRAVMTEQHLQPKAPPARPSEPPPVTLLSAREREVIGLVANGLSNAAIAKRLSLSDHTVKRHVANILLKLNLPTRAAAAAFVGRGPAD